VKRPDAGCYQWEGDGIRGNETRMMPDSTYLIRAYSLRPLARGMGLNVPMHPLNLGSELGREGLIVFHVTNIALPSAPLLASLSQRQAVQGVNRDSGRVRKGTYNLSLAPLKFGAIGNLLSKEAAKTSIQYTT